jgi:hypothetical protein
MFHSCLLGQQLDHYNYFRPCSLECSSCCQSRTHHFEADQSHFQTGKCWRKNSTLLTHWHYCYDCSQLSNRDNSGNKEFSHTFYQRHEARHPGFSDCNDTSGNNRTNQTKFRHRNQQGSNGCCILSSLACTGIQHHRRMGQRVYGFWSASLHYSSQYRCPMSPKWRRHNQPGSNECYRLAPLCMLDMWHRHRKDRCIHGSWSASHPHNLRYIRPMSPMWRCHNRLGSNGCCILASRRGMGRRRRRLRRWR